MARSLADELEERIAEAEHLRQAEAELAAAAARSAARTPPPRRPAPPAPAKKPSNGLFGRRAKAAKAAPPPKRAPNDPPFTGQPTPARRGRRDDLTLAALGVTLGLICAMFPWYIFFNPENFGVRAIRFDNSPVPALTGPLVLSDQPQRVGAPSEALPIPPEALDLLATGTTAMPEDAEDEAHAAANLGEQPFPMPVAGYEVVHIANGRALLMDDTGLFVVQPGSLLPDNSRVASIEKRGAAWVLVTSDRRELAPGG